MNEMILAPRSAEFNEILAKSLMQQGLEAGKGIAAAAGNLAARPLAAGVGGAQAASNAVGSFIGSGNKGGQYVPGMGNPIANLGYGLMAGGGKGGIRGAAKRGQQQRFGMGVAESKKVAQKVRGSGLPENVAGAFSGVRGGNTQQQPQQQQPQQDQPQQDQPQQQQPQQQQPQQQQPQQQQPQQQSFTPNKNLRNQRYKQEMERANTRGGTGTGLLSNIATLGMSGLARGAYNLSQRRAGRQNMAAIEQGAPLSTLKSEMETIGLREMIRNRQTTEAIRDAYR